MGLLLLSAPSKVCIARHGIVSTRTVHAFVPKLQRKSGTREQTATAEQVGSAAKAVPHALGCFSQSHRSVAVGETDALLAAAGIWQLIQG